MATTQELIDYYADLLILQYLNKPKAYAHVQTLVEPLIMNQTPLAIQNAFNIETAVGVQLDILGKYVGANRVGYDSIGNPINLDDDDYRILIQLVLIKNNAGSSLATIQDLLAGSFPGMVFVSDNQAMGLNYLVIETIGTPDLLEVLVNGDYFPRPMGVQVSITTIPEIDGLLFGFRTYDDAGDNISPFNSYGLYNLEYPWLSYFT
jgi:hypothetical protein